VDDSPVLEKIGLVSSTTLVAGSMIGSGIFIVSAEIARTVGSPGLLLLTWIIAAIMTLIAALSYGELAAAMPHAGGQYVYLREAFSPLYGFLYGWGLFLVIQTGTVAAVCVGFAKFLAVFIPMPAEMQPWIAITCIIVLTIINCFGIQAGAWVQNVFTFTKTAALLGLIVAGYLWGHNAAAAHDNFTNIFRGAGFTFETIRLVAVAMVGSLFAADAWNNITFTAGEVENPRKNVPLSLLLGAGGVMVLYLAANWVYLNVLPLEAIQHAPNDRVGTAAAQAILAANGGNIGEKVMAAFIVISAFGCSNGLILAGARVYYAMARDGLFFNFAARLHPKTHAPVAALALQAIWASMLCLSGTYSQLLDYVIFVVLLFYILTIAGVFVLRVKRPDMERPYRALGYPLLPALYIVLALGIEAALLWGKPRFSFSGLVIVLLGIPVYVGLRSKRRMNAIRHNGTQVPRHPSRRSFGRRPRP
jgi:APA family basic amino acid/polyamine antiporter